MEGLAFSHSAHSSLGLYLLAFHHIVHRFELSLMPSTPRVILARCIPTAARFNRTPR